MVLVRCALHLEEHPIELDREAVAPCLQRLHVPLQRVLFAHVALRIVVACEHDV